MDNRKLTIVTLIAGIVAFLVWFRRRARKHLPPGPPADPLIGHLRIIPQQKQAEAFHEWAKIYGDVMFLEVPGRKMVVLNSVESARALLDDKGSNYSCRPWFVVWELMGWTSSLTLLPHGKQFLKHRKMLQTFFGKKESLAFNDILAEEARILVKSLLEAGKGDLLKYVHRLTVSNIIRVACGHQVKSDDDLFMQLAEVFAQAASNSGPIGNTTVDLLPWLRHFPSWFPGTHYATMARSWYKVTRKMYDISVEVVEAEMKENRMITSSFVSEKLEELADHVNDQQNDDAVSLEDIKSAGATIFAAGKETSYDTLTGFILAMVLNPEIQQRAYEEIIAVVGQDRLPDLSDRESLPYLECILHENHRWHVVLPLGVPHRAQEDDIFNGMFIPNNTVVIPNHRAMSRDERVYSDPLKFDPSRYLPAPEGKAEPCFSAAFGFGRRICPGRHFADLAIWHVVACLLATLEILPPKDAKGNVVIPEVNIVEGFGSAVAPFEFEVRARSEKARALIAEIEK
ncbi:hypothetical protein E1B28_005533 [Marasmius oreades]|uniref:Cytochrome P450 n=1 Tax=Marasmius oreades TaxID=181124 RepID=A0A9P7UUP0_9AGAR|nr:uncharacterized protein E1B28_005533 [Marasmius oreades]KAG7094713.1 hypothetical protein E1B28_005533 [Marasmius oreades]